MMRDVPRNLDSLVHIYIIADGLKIPRVSFFSKRNVASHVGLLSELNRQHRTREFHHATGFGSLSLLVRGSPP
jgi:hypothetical protein